MRLFGQDFENAKEFELDDIFLSRLMLLIIMMKSYLGGDSMGMLQKKAVLQNAAHIESECITMSRHASGSCVIKVDDNALVFYPVFYMRVKLLSTMAKSIIQRNSMGKHRIKVLKDNLEIICGILSDTPAVKDIDVLKVA